MTTESKERALGEVTIEPQMRNDGINRVTVTFSNVSIGLSLQDILEYQKSTSGLGMPEFRDCDMITYVLVYKAYSRDELVDYQLDQLYAKATSKYVHEAVENGRDDDGSVVPGLVGNVMPTSRQSDTTEPPVITPECKERFEKYEMQNKK